MRRLLLLLAVLGCRAVPALSAELVIAWTFPPDVALDSFLVSAQSTTGGQLQVDQWRLPRPTTPTCAALPPPVTPDMVCMRPPQCLPPGLYRISVQAERGPETSPPSAAQLCEALPGCMYNCAQFGEVNTLLSTPTAPLPTLTPPPPPDLAPLQALAQDLAALERGIPTQPVTPVVATPPT